MYWIFKKESTDILFPQINLEQKRRFTGNINDKIVILEEIDGDWSFTEVYSISNITQKAIPIDIDEVSFLFQINIQLTLKNKLSKINTLDFFSFSISRITNFQHPIKNFKGKFNKIYEVEFENIENGIIYAERTMLGTILNNIHELHLQEFLLLLAISNPYLLSDKTSIPEAYQLLKSYLQDTIVNPAKYILEIKNILDSLFPLDIVDKIGFIDSSEYATYEQRLILPQQIIISKYLENFSELLNYDFSRDQREFENHFNKFPLPVKLR